jgi:hypothetical protein
MARYIFSDIDERALVVGPNAPHHSRKEKCSWAELQGAYQHQTQLGYEKNFIPGD